jgi:hypothetical protein
MGALAFLLQQLTTLEANLEPFVRTRGRPLVQEVPHDLRPDPVTGRVTCELERTSPRPARASLVVRNGRLVPGCSCSTFGAQGQCRHVAALVLALRARLTSRVTAPPRPGLPPPSWESLRHGPVELSLRVRLLAQAVDVVVLAHTPIEEDDEDEADTRSAGRVMNPSDLRALEPRIASVSRPLAHDVLEAGGLEALSPVLRLALAERHGPVAVEGTGPVRVLRAKPGVKAVPAAEGLHALRPSLDGEPVVPWPGRATVAKGIAAAVSGGRLLFAPLDPREEEVLSGLAAEGTTLGDAALLAAAARVAAACPSLPIDLPGDLAGERVDANRTVVLRA